MARILYINHYAGSLEHGMEFRPFFMAREWQRAGHDVRIVAATFSHLRQSNPKPSSSLEVTTVDGIPYYWISTPPYEGNGVGRIVNMLAFVAGLYRHGAQITKDFRPDAVIASSTYPLDIYPARRIARMHGAKLVFEVHDLWPLSPRELGGMSKYHPFIVTMQLAEDYACKHADRVVSMLPKADQHLVTRGMDPAKFVYVPNGTVVEEWKLTNGALPREHVALFERYRAEGRFVVLYAGAHGLLNNLDLFVDAAAKLKAHPVALCSVGQGPEKERLQARAAELGLRNIDFLPSVPKASVPELLDRADALFLSFAPQPLFRFGVSPNKLMDYMMAAKPIVAAMDAGNDPVAESGSGVTVSPNDADALAAAILQIAASTPAERAAMGERGRATAMQQYAYGPLARRFAACMTEPEHAPLRAAK